MIVWDTKASIGVIGEEPPLMNSVAVVTDNDRTKERGIAYHCDIQLAKCGEAVCSEMGNMKRPTCLRPASSRTLSRRGGCADSK